MKITITITDTEGGGVSVVCDHPTEKLLELVRGNRIGAATSACMYVLGMLTWCVKRSREMGPGQQLIHLPPGIRES